ncbi:MAG: 7-cyano-7-deazaguanine synthase QueC [Planctomycetota bacterium]
MQKKTVLLLSGGLDSATVLAIAKSKAYEVHAISFHYGQIHRVELECAKQLGKGATSHRLIYLDPSAFEASALTGRGAVPKDRNLEQESIPVTYVPARNTIFLAYALGFAETIGARNIHLGVNALDYSGYPDCRPEYIEAFQKLANLATKAGVEGNLFTIHAPLIQLTKAKIIEIGLKLGVEYAQTLSCYDPQKGLACGHCDSCQLRQKGFAELGLKDPAEYADTL